jgi:DNA-damage-inducible protein J
MVLMDTRVHTRIDADLKAEGDALLKQLGMTSAELIRMTYRQLVMRKGLPFDVKIPDAETIDAFNEDLNQEKALSATDFKDKYQKVADETGQGNE